MRVKTVLHQIAFGVALGVGAGFLACWAISSGAVTDSGALRNPAIDMQGYLDMAHDAAAWRKTHRVSEADFVRLSGLPGTIVLDARSAEKFAELHVRGAVNLSFPDITVDSLARRLPDKATRILIYCNNNFANAQGPFPTKKATASLNLSTYIALYTYGYRNVFELGPQIDIDNSIIPFESGKAHN
jgi:Rhodanese-like domain